MPEEENKPITQKKESPQVQVKLDLEKFDSNYLKGAIEAIIFMSPKSIGLKQIYKVLPGIPHDLIDIQIAELMHEYYKRNSGISIVKDGDNIEMVVKPEYSSFNVFSAGASLSKGELKTLAYISLNSPVMQSKITGKRPYEHIQKLKDLNLVTVEKKGRRHVLVTTKKFEMLYPDSRKKKK
jgi:chromosome segregation and condensation protein ScpB